MKLKTREMILIALFAALTAVGAFIRIPIPYVPITLQFVFCAFSGILLGSKLGMLSQLLYVLVGLVGVPIFTHGGGPGYIFQPTFGYLIGFILAAYIIGKFTERTSKLTFWKAFRGILMGLFIIYLFGVPYLYTIFNFYLGNAKSVQWAVYYGFLVSIGGDLLLSVIISIVSCKVVPILKKSGLMVNNTNKALSNK